ncbi:helix-turn-helix transcriptional regulator [Phytoactinopolyspora alkaliphila]|uniref:Helix-turn-helix transcriptional regulator n=1 Tax=Phytoactinopolyspora alkaliphila TaxID=1783498 RepID=A0A6N9YGZ1_9ACTN|nr:helix-turn-helix transcriptional regulator [Phytoactinopolyspora alkaliphila]
MLEALVDPVRRRIVSQLDAGDKDIKCGDFDIAVSKSTATHHFTVLREAGLIRQYYVGTARMNSLRRAEMDEAFPGLLDALTSASRTRHLGCRGEPLRCRRLRSFRVSPRTGRRDGPPGRGRPGTTFPAGDRAW